MTQVPDIVYNQLARYYPLSRWGRAVFGLSNFQIANLVDKFWYALEALERYPEKSIMAYCDCAGFWIEREAWMRYLHDTNQVLEITRAYPVGEIDHILAMMKTEYQMNPTEVAWLNVMLTDEYYIKKFFDIWADVYPSMWFDSLLFGWVEV